MNEEQTSTDAAVLGFVGATPDDTNRLLALMREFYAHEGLHFDEAVARRGLAMLLADDANVRAWFLIVDGETVGYLVLGASFSLEFHGRDAFIDELFVREPWRGRGIGTRALERAIEECRALGIEALHLEVGHDNPRARELYERLGFVDHERYLMTRWVRKE